MTIDRLGDIIKLAEGLRLRPYKDSLGFWTVGYGHFIGSNLPPEMDREFTLDECIFWLNRDLDTARKAASELPEIKELSPARVDCLVELVFNMGLDKWLKFVKTRSAIRDGRWHDASNELKNSLWYTQVGHIRGDRIADQLKSGTYRVV